MAIVDLVMPKMGESIVEATIITWLKAVGEQVDAEEPILEVATDKVDSEVPSTVTGTLVEILHQPEDIVPVGGLLARIETEGTETTESAPPPVLECTEEDTKPEPKASESQASKVVSPVVSQSNTSELGSPSVKATSGSAKSTLSVKSAAIPSNVGDRFYSPLVRNIARAEGITAEELNNIVGTGADGRVSKSDLILYVQQKKLGQIALINNPLIQGQPALISHVDAAPTTQAQTTTPTVQKAVKSPNHSSSKASSGDEIVELDRMRRVIAQHMKNSQNLSATVTSMVEADATHLVHWRNRSKDAYQAKYGEKLTFSPLFTEAVIKAIGDYPTINASLDGENLIIKKDVNIGIATAMENGNLIVPVIKKAQTLSLVGLASQLNDITGRARKNQLKPEEIRGGTFTISNIGTYGNIIGTPIINQPELAILALGAIKKKPIIQETPHGDIIAIRHMMFLSLSFDHRVIDGYLGGVFLNRIAHYIESFDPNRSI